LCPLLIALLASSLFYLTILKFPVVAIRCGASFVVEIVSEQFEGKRLLERHRMVNAALEEELKEIHALSIKKTVTPEQWKQQQEANQSNAAA